MADARPGSERDQPRRLPRGRHALAPEEVAADQRRRLIEAVPRVAAERGYEAMSVADIVRAAGVSRNAFYDNFGDKRECFAVAHEAGHERLLETLAGSCRRGASLEERVETALGAALDLLAREPALARLLFVEAPAAGAELALRYHDWLRRYGTLLRDAIPRVALAPGAAAEIDAVVVGGIASRIGGELLQDSGARLRTLIPSFVSYVLAFYATAAAEGGAETGGVAIKPPGAGEQPQPRRRRAGA